MRTTTNRRRFLRELGLGTSVLPFITGLPSLRASETSVSPVPKRLIVMFSPNGTLPDQFWPDEYGELQLKPMLSALEPFKDQILLLGEYLAERNEKAQCVKPIDVVEDLMQIVFRVERLVWLSSLLAATTTALLMGLVISLSVRLRAREMQTMSRLGCSRSMTALLLGTEIVIMVGMSIVIAGAAAWISRSVVADSMQQFLF